ncbi:DUF6576 domain-containing protein [Kordia zhangzhouensis]|uniref:DUF6576 domain-containing protein n=1 Tax=Kordia zhangzhouensis TaxID=1620405 RepID=UPI0006297FDB|nr:DUF6576 domain-containing protein [Kordia zhangzhouensis]
MSIMPFISIAVIAIFIYLIFKSKKETSSFSKTSSQGYQTIDDKFNAERKQKQERINRILEKINDKGVESLTSHEKAILDEYSNSN